MKKYLPFFYSLLFLLLFTACTTPEGESDITSLAVDTPIAAQKAQSVTQANAPETGVETYYIDNATGQRIVVNNLTSTTNPYLSDEAKQHLVNNLILTYNECDQRFNIAVYTDLGSGTTEVWGFDLNGRDYYNNCIDILYHVPSNGKGNNVSYDTK